jgi:hypothetical protein
MDAGRLSKVHFGWAKVVVRGGGWRVSGERRSDSALKGKGDSKMTKKTLAALAVSALLVAACGTGTGTDDTSITGDTSLGGTGTTMAGTATTATGTGDTQADTGGVADVAAEVTALEAELAQFASEIEAEAPEPVVSAYNDLEVEVAGLISAASDMELTNEELEPVQDAATALDDAVTEADVDLSAEFMDFWADFSTRLQALAA